MPSLMTRAEIFLSKLPQAMAELHAAQPLSPHSSELEHIGFRLTLALLGRLKTPLSGQLNRSGMQGKQGASE